MDNMKCSRHVSKSSGSNCDLYNQLLSVVNRGVINNYLYIHTIGSVMEEKNAKNFQVRSTVSQIRHLCRYDRHGDHGEETNRVGATLSAAMQSKIYSTLKNSFNTCYRKITQLLELDEKATGNL
ncbi:hypothetical protein NPIL_75451 [Nephila pilipes]|uniref:Uncharacterized protein n=1 Tax=Nephila pilipes TaxID=299642 RepID=A0A8X6QA97_NEPPI|nr:hypothetical protein NPIL_75451 [Nephila pilipes]